MEKTTKYKMNSDEISEACAEWLSKKLKRPFRLEDIHLIDWAGQPKAYAEHMEEVS